MSLPLDKWESVLVQGYFLNFFLLINRYSAIPFSICFLSHVYYQWWWRWTKRSNKTFSLYSTYYESSIPFFPREKGYFCTYLTRGVYFFTLKDSRFYFCHCVLSVFVLLLLFSWMMEDSSNRPISHWTHQSMNLSIYGPVNQYSVVEETPSNCESER